MRTVHGMSWEQRCAADAEARDWAVDYGRHAFYWSAKWGQLTAVADGTTTLTDLADALATGTATPYQETLAATYWVEAASYLAIGAEFNLDDAQRGHPREGPAQDRAEVPRMINDGELAAAQQRWDAANAALVEARQVRDDAVDREQDQRWSKEAESEQAYYQADRDHVASNWAALMDRVDAAKSEVPSWEREADQDSYWAELGDSHPAVRDAFWEARDHVGLTAEDFIHQRELDAAYTAAGEAITAAAGLPAPDPAAVIAAGALAAEEAAIEASIAAAYGHEEEDPARPQSAVEQGDAAPDEGAHSPRVASGFPSSAADAGQSAELIAYLDGTEPDPYTSDDKDQAQLRPDEDRADAQAAIWDPAGMTEADLLLEVSSVDEPTGMTAAQLRDGADDTPARTPRTGWAADEDVATGHNSRPDDERALLFGEHGTELDLDAPLPVRLTAAGHAMVAVDEARARAEETTDTLERAEWSTTPQTPDEWAAAESRLDRAVASGLADPGAGAAWSELQGRAGNISAAMAATESVMADEQEVARLHRNGDELTPEQQAWVDEAFTRDDGPPDPTTAAIANGPADATGEEGEELDLDAPAPVTLTAAGHAMVAVEEARARAKQATDTLERAEHYHADQRTPRSAAALDEAEAASGIAAQEADAAAAALAVARERDADAASAAYERGLPAAGLDAAPPELAYEWAAQFGAGSSQESELAVFGDPAAEETPAGETVDTAAQNPEPGWAAGEVVAVTQDPPRDADSPAPVLGEDGVDHSSEFSAGGTGGDGGEPPGQAEVSTEELVTAARDAVAELAQEQGSTQAPVIDAPVVEDPAAADDVAPVPETA